MLADRQKPFRADTSRIIVRIVLLFAATLGVLGWEWNRGATGSVLGRSLIASVDGHVVKLKMALHQSGHYRVHRIRPLQIFLVPYRDSAHILSEEEFDFAPCDIEFVDKPFSINILTDDSRLAGVREIQFLSRDFLRAHDNSYNNDDLGWTDDGRELRFNEPFDNDFISCNETLGVAPDEYWTPFPLNQSISENVAYSVKATLISSIPKVILAVLAAFFLTSQRLWMLCARFAIRRPGCCPICGFDLRGSGVDAGCPECGWNRPEGEGKSEGNE